jgi:type IV secretion system protein VirB1
MRLQRSHYCGCMQTIDLYSQCFVSVNPATMRRLVAVESGGAPLSIGVVGAKLTHQPSTIAEAIEVVRRLEASGANYSVGLTQVNRIHFRRLGWDRHLSLAFDACSNLRAGAKVLTECYLSATGSGFMPGQQALNAALGCYYTGSFESRAGRHYASAVLSSVTDSSQK